MDISENTEINMTDQQQRFGRIPDARRRSGLCRAKLYQIAAQHSGLFRKAGGATIVDLQKLDEILATCPPARLSTRKEVAAA
jgi:hypothetical protein